MDGEEKMRVPSFSPDDELRNQLGISVELLRIMSYLSCENVFL